VGPLPGSSVPPGVRDAERRAPRAGDRVSVHGALGPRCLGLGARARGAERAGRLALGQDGGARRGARPGSDRDLPPPTDAPRGHHHESTRRGQCDFTGTVAATLSATPAAFGLGRWPSPTWSAPAPPCAAAGLEPFCGGRGSWRPSIPPAVARGAARTSAEHRLRRSPEHCSARPAPLSLRALGRGEREAGRLGGLSRLVRGGTAEPTGDALAPTANAGVLRCPGCRPLTGHCIGRVLQDTRQRAAVMRGRSAGTTPPRVPLRDGQLDECFHVEKL
jgi:hypothetical protein